MHVIHVCENCRRLTELFYCKSVDAYLCERCADELTEPPECDGTWDDAKYYDC